MSRFRISLGDASVDGALKKGSIDAVVGKLVANKIDTYKSMSFSALKNLPSETTIEYKVQGRNIQVTFYKIILEEDNLLLVVQAAYKTFKRPNYISLGFVGRIVVGGIQVNAKDEFSSPKENLLWKFA